MDTEKKYDPLHVALKYIAAACIDEGLLEEAESMARYLELVNVSPRTVGLLQVWTLSQRGHLAEALRTCEVLTTNHPEADEFQPLLAVLRYACADPRWQAVCERLLESPTASADSKRLANSLIDRTFGVKSQPFESTSDAGAAVAEPDIDFASMSAYLRA